MHALRGARRSKRKMEWILPAYKPGSVECYHSDGHSSRSTVTHALKQPTRSVLIEVGHLSLPIWPCSHWGLPSHDCYQSCGELLPRRFTLACMPKPAPSAVCFLLHYPSMLFLHRPGVTWQCALWSPDFPRAFRILATIRPTASRYNITTCQAIR
jgi:hypothetical protein